MQTPILEVKNICKQFGSNRVLDKVSVSFEKGKTHALIGVNGAGKSTLVKIMQGVFQADSGEILLDGKNVSFSGPQDAMKHGIYMVFQELNLFKDMSVTENILMGKMPIQKGAIDWKLSYKIVDDFLKNMNINIDPHEKVGSLTLAQQQLVEIAKNVYKDLSIIFLDEPSSSLSHSDADILYQLIDDLKAKGITVVLITHKMDEIFNLCDYVSILRDGHKVADGPVSDFTVDQITQHMLGKVVDVFKKSEEIVSDRDKILLSVEHLNYKNRLKDITFDLYQNEVLAITGLVGSGKSDLARTLFGVHGEIDGRVCVNGQAVNIRSPISAIRNGIGYLPISRKDEGIIEGFTVKKNITISILHLLGFVVNRKKEDQIGEEMIRKFNVRPNDPELTIGSLSGGNQQKAVLSRWIAAKKKIILLDEPTRGIDVGAKKEIYDNLKELAKSGIGIVIFSSETDELLSASDRILVMHEGEIVRELITAQTTNNEILEYSMAGKIA
jgi:ABC-type sugar transport system ATPase subunit